MSSTESDGEGYGYSFGDESQPSQEQSLGLFGGVDALFRRVQLEAMEANEEVGGGRGCIEEVRNRGVDITCMISVHLPENLPAMARRGWDLCREAGPLRLRCTVDDAGKRSIDAIENAGTKVAPQLLRMAQDFAGSWAGLIRHVRRRSAELHRFCTVCGAEHVGGQLMPLPTVCSRPLCLYQWQKYPRFRVGANVGMVATQRLLRAFFSVAAVGGGGVVEPPPVVMGPDSKPVHFDAKTIERVARSLQQSDGCCSRGDCPRCLIDAWITLSNRSLLMSIPEHLEHRAFNTSSQYHIMANAPELEAAFARHRSLHGSQFFYHGSPTENWHSIMRNGFYVAQAGQVTHGAVHGHGVYVAPSILTSHGYTRVFRDLAKSQNPAALPAEFNIRVMAICEVAMAPSVKTGGGGWCLVIPDAEMVVPRFLLSWSGPPTALSYAASSDATKTDDAMQAWCRERMAEFTAGDVTEPSPGPDRGRSAAPISVPSRSEVAAGGVTGLTPSPKRGRTTAPIIVPSRSPSPAGEAGGAAAAAACGWTCGACTFVNAKPHALACEVCGTIKG